MPGRGVDQPAVPDIQDSVEHGDEHAAVEAAGELFATMEGSGEPDAARGATSQATGGSAEHEASTDEQPAQPAPQRRRARGASSQPRAPKAAGTPAAARKRTAGQASRTRQRKPKE